MFQKIISTANFRLAYFQIIDQFAADRKNFKYHGLDNLLLKDYDLNSDKLIALARKELIQKKEITPALAVKIPKKNNPEKLREIFIYNLKERLKAQAISQVLLPEFEKHFSDRLFSYRPGKPPYLAAKNFGRRYRRSFSSDQALIVDLANYSDLIDKQILLAQLKEIFSDADVLDVLRLFIFNPVYRDGIIQKPTKGLVQGVPLIALFANLYLTDLDFKYQSLVPFYIRVGDDIALLDKRPEKLEKLKRDLMADLQAKKLVVNERKLYLGPASANFSFLGYNFHDGLISLEKSFVRKTELNWKRILIYKNLPDERKDYLLKKIMAEPKNNYNFQFQKIVKDKSQINDSEQIIKLSETFFRILTKFFYLRYSPRRRRLLETRIKDLGIKSLYSFYTKFHYERD
jgi:retron-type reverse transcriptase